MGGGSGGGQVMRTWLAAVLLLVALVAGCTPKDLCAEHPPGTLLVSDGGAITVCHETPERVDLTR
jgi:hypothetical protein